MKLSKETISLLEKEGWTIREESDGYVTIGNCSPRGEDLTITVKEDDFSEEIKKYAQQFDVDEHVEMWVSARNNGTSGIPSSIEELMEDAEDIQEMLNDLADALS